MKTNEYINKVRTTLKHFVAGATIALVAMGGLLATSCSDDPSDEN